MIRIVGVGVTDGHITERAKKIIEDAEVVYGSERAIKLAEKCIKGEKVILRKFSSDVYESINNEKRKVVVLSTGDPMVTGLGRRIEGVVEPGISSVQLALARLKVDLTEVIVMDSHGKNSYESIEEVLKFRDVLILADSSFDLSFLGGREITILENLGLENEIIQTGKACELKIRSELVIIYVKGGD
jgi:cobalt-precorrin-7 (C5)-methyltransferase